MTTNPLAGFRNAAELRAAYGIQAGDARRLRQQNATQDAGIKLLKRAIAQLVMLVRHSDILTPDDRDAEIEAIAKMIVAAADGSAAT